MKKWIFDADKSGRQNFKSGLITALLCALAFFVVTMPFRGMFSILNVTEIRPVNAFPPVFGIAFGFWGAIGCCIGNFAADIISGEDVMLSVWGFFLQFLYGYLPYLLWRCINPCEGNERLRIDRFDKLLKYILVVLADSVVMTLSLAIVFQFIGISDIISPLTLFLLLNNFDFCIIIGIPLMIIVYRTRRYIQCVREGKDKESIFHIPLNERMLLGIVVIGIITGCLVGAIVFEAANHTGHSMIEVWNRVYVVVGVEVNVFFILSFIVLHFIEKNITLPIESLAEISEKYSSQSSGFDNEMMIKECEKFCDNKTEAGHLARSYVQMVKNLDAYIEDIKNMTAEKERIGAELAVARKIQSEMLPHDFDICSARDDFRIYADMKPAKEVGGDFYDFYMLDDHTAVFLIADVSDKGIPAAMFMMKSKTIIRDLAERGLEPDEIFTKANEKLCENNDAGMFVTAWLGILDLKTGLMKFANAGHNPPLVRHRNGRFEYMKERSGIVLACMEGIKYRKNEMQLEAGAQLYLYTDGVTEAADNDGQLYGEERLLELLNSVEKSDPENICEYVKNDVDKFVGSAPQCDDITMLAVNLNCISGDYNISVIPNESSRNAVNSFVENLIDRLDITTKTAYSINIVFDEIYTNILNYSKARLAEISCKSESGKLYITFEDDGVPYNPSETAEPDITLSAEEREIGGLGIFMVKKMTESMEYAYKDNKNILRLVIALE
ncbi:MAG: SpoIIE family protein phosphatase [Clostridia bacterium]